MTTRLLFALAGCLVAFCSNAQILVYKGNVVDKRQGDGGDSRHTYRSILIVDSNSGATRKINYYQTQGGFYDLEAERAFTTNSVSLPSGRTQWVLASVSPATETTPTSSIFVKGIRTRLQVAAKKAISAPNVLDWSLTIVGPDTAGVVRAREEKGTFTFHPLFTTSVNNQNDDLTQAEMHIRARLEQAGYREIEIK